MNEAGLKLIALVLLGPVSAAYDFLTNPAAPPQIFAAQFEEAFGRPPPQIIPRPTTAPHVVRFKRVYVTHGS